MMFCLLGDPLCSKQINPLEYIRLALNVLWGALLNARKLNNPQGRFNAEVTSWTYTEGVQPPGRKIWLSVIFQIWLSQKNIKIIHFFLRYFRAKLHVVFAFHLFCLNSINIETIRLYTLLLHTCFACYQKLQGNEWRDWSMVRILPLLCAC